MASKTDSDDTTSAFVAAAAAAAMIFQDFMKNLLVVSFRMFIEPVKHSLMPFVISLFLSLLFSWFV